MCWGLCFFKKSNCSLLSSPPSAVYLGHGTYSSHGISLKTHFQIGQDHSWPNSNNSLQKTESVNLLQQELELDAVGQLWQILPGSPSPPLSSRKTTHMMLPCLGPLLLSR
uniref:Uncharacterized protein n=1 Tax=Sphaerodactylus townsendi TaxID=933632 RepID=A0ACB8FBL9_9SAUR